MSRPAAVLAPIVETDLQIVRLLETLIEENRSLIEEVRGLRADLVRDHRPRRGLSRADRDRLSRLLPAIAGAKGSEEFTVNELLELRAVRVVAAGLAPAALGRLLQRARGVPLDGYVVKSDETELQRRVWYLVKTI